MNKSVPLEFHFRIPYSDDQYYGLNFPPKLKSRIFGINVNVYSHIKTEMYQYENAIRIDNITFKKDEYDVLYGFNIYEDINIDVTLMDSPLWNDIIPYMVSIYASKEVFDAVYQITKLFCDAEIGSKERVSYSKIIHDMCFLNLEIDDFIIDYLIRDNSDSFFDFYIEF